MGSTRATCCCGVGTPDMYPRGVAGIWRFEACRCVIGSCRLGFPAERRKPDIEGQERSITIGDVAVSFVVLDSK